MIYTPRLHSIVRLMRQDWSPRAMITSPSVEALCGGTAKEPERTNMGRVASVRTRLCHSLSAVSVLLGCSDPAVPKNALLSPTAAAAGNSGMERGMEHSGAAASSALEAPRDAVHPPQELALVAQNFEAARLSFDGIAAVPVQITRWDVGGVFQQGAAKGEERFEILVRAHGDESLTSFERDHSGYSVLDRTHPIVCGKAAKMLRARRAEQNIACVITATGSNHPARIPETEIIALELEHAGLHVVFTVEIAGDQPAHLRQLAQEVIRSIRCM